MPAGSAPSGTPVGVLRGFSRLELVAGETSEVAFELNRRDVSYWDATAQTWRVLAGEFRLEVGFSSRNLPKSAEVKIL
ncbi:hypothetical protein GQ607_012748 [Colletotrichum asianum]|uniref:beta-glucosidase n=1 Tax=Colletotrichum asianum TaxID=702518 RepID=A0A8H3W501_9PEZI|nr:hypothetical protein GQ607_012748 [Colletotrichum asianum]